MRSLAPTLLTLLTLASVSGCRADSSQARDPAPEPQAEPEPAPRPASAAAEPAEPAEPAADPQRGDKLADLDDLCEAVDHDYKDGTLGDYYAGLEMRTDWGKAQLAAGNASITPARLLEEAVAELSPGAAAPALAHCRILLDYIDDVE